mgnify:CR=1 FL=1
MLSDDIGTGIDQCDSSLFFGSWIIPGIGPEDFDLYVRVDALRAQGKGIDAADYFRDRERCYITNNVGFCFFTGNDTCDIAGFVHTAEVVATLGAVLKPEQCRKVMSGYFFATLIVGSI